VKKIILPFSIILIRKFAKANIFSGRNCGDCEKKKHFLLLIFSSSGKF